MVSSRTMLCLAFLVLVAAGLTIGATEPEILAESPNLTLIADDVKFSISGNETSIKTMAASLVALTAAHADEVGSFQDPNKGNLDFPRGSGEKDSLYLLLRKLWLTLTRISRRV